MRRPFLHLVTGEERGQGVSLFVWGRRAPLPGAARSLKSKAKGTAWRRSCQQSTKRTVPKVVNEAITAVDAYTSSHRMKELSKEDLKGELS